MSSVIFWTLGPTGKSRGTRVAAGDSPAVAFLVCLGLSDACAVGPLAQGGAVEEQRN